MRQLKAITLMAVIFLLFTACSTNIQHPSDEKNKEAGSPKITKAADNIDINNNKIEIQAESSKENLEEAAKKDNDTQSSQDIKNIDIKNTSNTDKKKDTGLVAKSENTVSSQDKEAILKELDDELNSLFNDIDKMEELKNEDLEIQ